MSRKEEERHFDEELDKLITRFAAEYELTTCQAIGLLTGKAMQLATQQMLSDDEETEA